MEVVPGSNEEAKIANLVARRSIILALVGSTPEGNTSVDQILANGYLGAVKLWLNDILKGTVGGVDLLLHLLSNITDLPVTKSIVKDSGMGKTVGTIEKKSICAGTPNESAIKSRVQAIKDSWKESVKARKEETAASAPPSKSKHSNDSDVGSQQQTAKRSLPSAPSAQVPKKAKVNDGKTPKSASALSNLLRKVVRGDSLNGDSPTKSSSKKKRSVKWADHFGSDLNMIKLIGSNDENTPAGEVLHAEPTAGFLDRTKRDRHREKELLAKVKKAKLLDDDDEEDFIVDRKPAAAPSIVIQPTTVWHRPSLLQGLPPPADLNSKEKLAQDTRMTTVTPALYQNEFAVPSSPNPMSDIEQALDMTSQSSTTTEMIPFIVPQAPTPAAAPAPVPTALPIPVPVTAPIPAKAPAPSLVATAEIVQSLNLPMFLVGYNVDALEQLASQPSLLSTFVDVNGMYDQHRLTTFVQTMSGGTAPPQQQATNSGYGASSAGTYDTAAGGSAYGSTSVSGGTYGQTSTYGNSYSRNAPRSTNQSSGPEGNLHLSGYGPTTTQAEILALFSPYVQVSEVVMKANFAFVNTRDPEGAQRAKESLSGTLLGGMPVRINDAQRKNSGPPQGSMGGSSGGSYYGQSRTNLQTPSYGQGAMTGRGQYGQEPQQLLPPGQPMQPAQPTDLSQVRDDRGNAATKNLFVAGYGPGTSEEQLRHMFSAFGPILSVMMKERFSFVNTTDRAVAVAAREALMGSDVNG
mmetsp:Transcript_27438/g.65869  ORF Transcript_27438/g.65869 Transcript_27438/m.65869 type:complete len:746 (+) Transcript_27438:1751-3988(+)